MVVTEAVELVAADAAGVTADAGATAPIVRVAAVAMDRTEAETRFM